MNLFILYILINEMIVKLEKPREQICIVQKRNLNETPIK